MSTSAWVVGWVLAGAMGRAPADDAEIDEPAPTTSPSTVVSAVPSNDPVDPASVTTRPPSATPPPPRFEDPFDVELAVDLPVIALTGSIYIASEIIANHLPWDGCHACDPSRIGPLDRRVLDNYVPAAAPISDVLLYSSLVLPIAADLGDVLGHRTGLRGWGEDVVVLVETATVNAALTTAVKFAVGRARPFSYGLDGSGRDPTDGDARLSFYSGHSSTTFAMATAYAYLFTARHPRSKWVAPVWILGYAFAGTTAALRVVAGKHFYSDVIVGAIAGTAVGVAIPAVHRLNKTPLGKQRRARLGAASDGTTSMIQLVGAF